MVFTTEQIEKVGCPSGSNGGDLWGWDWRQRLFGARDIWTPADIAGNPKVKFRLRAWTLIHFLDQRTLVEILYSLLNDDPNDPDGRRCLDIVRAWLSPAGLGDLEVAKKAMKDIPNARDIKKNFLGWYCLNTDNTNYQGAWAVVDRFDDTTYRRFIDRIVVKLTKQPEQEH